MFRVGHYNGCAKFEFNDRRIGSLYTKKDSEQRRSVSLHQVYYLHDIAIKVTYFTILPTAVG